MPTSILDFSSPWQKQMPGLCSMIIDQEQIEIFKRVIILDDQKGVQVGLACLAFSMLFHNRPGIIRFMLHYQHYARTTIFVH